METTMEKLYEAMFLVDSALVASDWDSVQQNIENILKRSGAEIVSLRKWDERKLAYDVNKKSRGTYLLCYFEVNGRKIQEIERNVQLNEQIMRVLILSAEPLSQEDIDKETPAQRAQKPPETTEQAPEPKETLQTESSTDNDNEAEKTQDQPQESAEPAEVTESQEPELQESEPEVIPENQEKD